MCCRKLAPNTAHTSPQNDSINHHTRPKRSKRSGHIYKVSERRRASTVWMPCLSLEVAASHGNLEAADERKVLDKPACTPSAPSSVIGMCSKLRISVDNRGDKTPSLTHSSISALYSEQNSVDTRCLVQTSFAPPASAKTAPKICRNSSKTPTQGEVRRKEVAPKVRRWSRETHYKQVFDDNGLQKS